MALYKEKQMKRRINTLMERKHIHGYPAFLRLLASNPRELAEFIDYITINVTEFFRTPEHWAAFEAELSHDLILHAQKPLRIWSCACSTGEEPYSLAISLLQHLQPGEFQIIATDIDEKVLQKASSGIYEERSLLLPEMIKERFFTRHGSSWAVSRELRSCVTFRRLDLLKDPYPPSCDVIVCRNVLIYFTDEAKERMYVRFRESLAPGGFLFTGNAEQIVYYKKYGYQKIRSFLYRRP